ncbi:hypothetical protein CUZ56_01393 [Saezia sanguinis]|uniref:Prophage CP4-57 regulatory protein (AlpA) n=1 Tax=Saezia sanguinis TaxID=1965230 RepID=A0A433SFE0_9BURK|nr:AlpA family transcriptional regulator [Saezia sanguinis]RUS67448.1 hypothetical protein CUZ56_01393 [Saezia sanguinis]
MDINNPTTNFILRLPDVEKRTGIKRSYIYKLIKQEKFPKPVPLGIRAVGWYSNEIDVWITNRATSSVTN